MTVKERACTKKHYEVTRENLPLSCPLPEMTLWEAHPRVYLPIEETGRITCPYCSSEYILTDWDPTDVRLMIEQE
jgi:uncharacterized Zn-finger protein